MNRIRVLLVDDHEIVRDGLRLVIDAQPDMQVVGEVAGGRDAVERAPAIGAQVAVMDIAMPEGNGLAATRELKRVCPRIAVVALTRYDEDAYVHALLGAGASGYVLKRSPSSELVAAIRGAAGGGRYLDTGLGARLAGAIRPAVTGGPAKITERETEVLRLMARGHSNKDIADRLAISVKTVEVHKANPMKKLGLRGRIDVVRSAVLQGWLLDT